MMFPLVRDLAAEGIPVRLTCGVLGFSTQAFSKVLDVQPKLAARVRLLATESTNKNDPHDALSVAIAALRFPAPKEVGVEDHAAVMKIWARRHRNLSSSHPDRLPPARGAVRPGRWRRP